MREKFATCIPPEMPSLEDIDNMVRVLRLYSNKCKFDTSPMRSLLIGWHREGKKSLKRITLKWDITIAMLKWWMELYNVTVLEHVECADRDDVQSVVPALPEDSNITLQYTQPMRVMRIISHRFIQTTSWETVASELNASVSELKEWVIAHRSIAGSFGLDSPKLRTLLDG